MTDIDEALELARIWAAERVLPSANDASLVARALLALATRAAKMEAVVEEARKHYERLDQLDRCAYCGWMLVGYAASGCVRGNCSMRPRPDRIYAPIRALLESTTLAAGDST